MSTETDLRTTALVRAAICARHVAMVCDADRPDREDLRAEALAHVEILGHRAIALEGEWK